MFMCVNVMESNQLFGLFLPSKPQQSPSLAQVKIEEAKRELVSILKVQSVMDDEMWLLTFFLF